MTNRTYTRTVSASAHADTRLLIGATNKLVDTLIASAAKDGIDVPIHEVHVQVIHDVANDRWDATATWPPTTKPLPRETKPVAPESGYYVRTYVITRTDPLEVFDQREHEENARRRFVMELTSEGVPATINGTVVQTTVDSAYEKYAIEVSWQDPSH
ncbi:hypothetical protein [Pseudoclavibacter sp. JSM 162008]|uniref:hypothetical protein n=1 Tax=Pseudoclavibacter sp. JSM 162008 TaxID=3229855 RepID=UPI003524815C